MTSQSGKSNSVQVSFRLPTDMYDKLMAVARANDRTVSQELRRLIRRHIGGDPS